MDLDFLPDNYQKLTTKKYVKISKMANGEGKFRILKKPIAGWLDWSLDKKPLRYRNEDKPRASVDPTKPMKVFWSFLVWDYSVNDVRVMEVTQQTIINGLLDLANDVDFGDFTKYDIKIKKKGDKQYIVTATAPASLPEAISNEVKRTPVNLEALFQGKDPFAEFEAEEEEFSLSEAKRLLLGTIDIPDADKYLDGYLSLIEKEAPKQGHEFKTVVEKWLSNTSLFLTAYKKWMASKNKEMSLQPTA